MRFEDKFLPLGFLLVDKLPDIIVHKKKFTYRGVDRRRLWGLDENKQSIEWQLQFLEEEYEDILEFIPNEADAKHLQRTAEAAGYPCEVIFCTVEPIARTSVLQDKEEIIRSGYTPDDISKWLNYVDTQRKPPQYRFIGFDVAYLGGDFYSPVWQEILGDFLNEHFDAHTQKLSLTPEEEEPFAKRRFRFWGHHTGCLEPYYDALNEYGLFLSAEVAMKFREDYVAHPEREWGEFFIYAVYVEDS